MRRSKTLEKIRNGDWALSTAVAVGDARVAELAGYIGFDCLWLDMEHKPCSQKEIFHMIMGARASDIDCVVRVRKRGYLDYFRALEDGAAGIMVPHVKSAAEAREIVYNAKYIPVGHRGMDFAGADSRFMLDSPKENMEFANRETFVMLQIEDKEALDELDEIAAIPGIDAFFIGPADLSASLGVFGESNGSIMAETIEFIANTIKKHGKWWGIPVATPEDAQKYLDMGASFINYSSDLGAIVREFKRSYNEFSVLKPRQEQT
ncbi:MAG: hypothetical protein E7409_07165 [Ruminococcaceae bacterium]|nr:hypothetical protein [Oscillospiraceae bacterium]